jgi:hypothetical protein
VATEITHGTEEFYQKPGGGVGYASSTNVRGGETATKVSFIGGLFGICFAIAWLLTGASAKATERANATKNSEVLLDSDQADRFKQICP